MLAQAVVGIGVHLWYSSLAGLCGRGPPINNFSWALRILAMTLQVSQQDAWNAIRSAVTSAGMVLKRERH